MMLIGFSEDAFLFQRLSVLLQYFIAILLFDSFTRSSATDLTFIECVSI